MSHAEWREPTHGSASYKGTHFIWTLRTTLSLAKLCILGYIWHQAWCIWSWVSCSCTIGRGYYGLEGLLEMGSCGRKRV